MKSKTVNPRCPQCSIEINIPKSSLFVSKEKIEKEINWLTEKGSNRIDMMRIHLLKERLGIVVNLSNKEEE